MLETPEAIIDFWFGEPGPDNVVAKRQTSLWFKKQVSTDVLIKERFERTLLSAAAGELDSWCDTALGRLALIIVLDQLPRNIYRDTPQAFAFDSLAREHCQAGLERHDDAALQAVRRLFFYLPLEHAEDCALQARSVALFRALAADVGEEDKMLFNGFLDYAQRHQMVVEQFGRFPHRNVILGRVSTAQELDFLTQPGSSF
jgi:uncharacterized protein (DUF924 family)